MNEYSLIYPYTCFPLLAYSEVDQGPPSPGFFTPERQPRPMSPLSYSRSIAPTTLSEMTLNTVNQFADAIAQGCNAVEPLTHAELHEFFIETLNSDADTQLFVGTILQKPLDTYILVKAFMQAKKPKPAAARRLFAPPAAPVLAPIRPPATRMRSFELRPRPIKKVTLLPPKPVPTKLSGRVKPKPLMIDPFARGLGKGMRTAEANLQY